MIGINVTLIYCNNDMFDGLEKVFDPTLLNPSLQCQKIRRFSCFKFLQTLLPQITMDAFPWISNHSTGLVAV